MPLLTPDKVSQYSALFEESGARNGVLSGMKPVSRLSFEIA